MSWTQGINVREDYSEEEIKLMDKLGEIKFGEGYKFTACVWDEAVPNVTYYDYCNEQGEYRSLKYEKE